MRIIFRRNQLDAILKHAEQCYPKVGYGFLLGKIAQEDIKVADVIRGEQQFAKVKDHILIPPKEFQQAQQWADSKGMDIIGLYRSRPNRSPRPLLVDLDQAWPNMAYLFVETRKQKAVQHKAYVLSEDRSAFYELDILIQ
ncbi:MAG: hypothetical protein D6814_03730 [Calditrichaeota bacterium]|nr:MAG: hypothetical protein D6814_03730 [Calditrichota bacterium]